ncbi:hypothetical protein CPU03_15750 [Edwardsiella tarda]|nr:hypothetical protein CPU03_15750 [Edwardsiella tarda]
MGSYPCLWGCFLIGDHPKCFIQALPMPVEMFNRNLAESHIKANKARLPTIWQIAVNGMNPGKP